MSSSKTYVFNILDKRDSIFMLQNSDKIGKPIFLNCPGQANIPSMSVIWKAGKKESDPKTRKKIRYIKGCDTIDFDEQVKQKYEPNPVADVIWIDMGQLVVSESPETKTLIEYMCACSWNEKAPERADDVKPLFTLFNPGADAEQTLKQRAEKKQAKELVESLFQEVGNSMEYDEERIDFLCKIFNVVDETYAQKCVSLIHLADTIPDSFVKSIADVKNVYVAAINEALQLNALNIAGDVASFPSTGNSFLKLESRTPEKKVEELVKFFLVSEGSTAWAQLHTEVDYIKKSELNKA